MRRAVTEDNLSGRQLTWDNSSNTCSICTKSFGRLMQRKHHCRQCGRLVCANCSQSRMVLPGVSGTGGGGGPNGGDAYLTAVNIDSKNNEANKPVRVCDPCKRILMAKQEKQMQQLQQIDKKIELLRGTSFISNCLMDIYFLDGQFKTICYDDSTTVSEIILTLSVGAGAGNMRIAMFEVEQDLFNPSHYAILQEEHYISNIMERWNKKGWKYAKVVFPIYDSRMIKNKMSASGTIVISRTTSTASHRSKGVAASQGSGGGPSPAAPRGPMGLNLPIQDGSMSPITTGIMNDMNGLDDQTTIAATNRSGSIDEVATLQREIDRLQGELDQAQRKIETWKAVYGRMGKVKTPTVNDDDDGDDGEGAELPRRLTSPDTASEVSAVTTSTTATSTAAPAAATKESTGRRDSFWGIKFSSSSTAKLTKSESTTRLSMTEAPNISPAPSAPSATSGSQQAPSITSGGGLRKNLSFELPEDYMENLTDYAIFDDNNQHNVESDVTTRQSMTGRGSITGRGSVTGRGSISGGPRASSVRGSIAEPAGTMSTMYFGTNDTEKEFLSDPSKFFREDQDRSVLFTRTFYHHINNLEAFLIKYEKFFETVLRQLSPNIEQEVNEAISHKRHVRGVTLWVSSLYHMIASFDNIYEQVVDYMEILRPSLRLVLPSIFRKLVRLPINDIDSVKCTMHCLLKENMLFNTEDAAITKNVIQDSLQQAIEESIFRNIVPHKDTLVYRPNGSTPIGGAEDEETNTLSTLSTYPVSMFLLTLTGNRNENERILLSLSFNVIETILANTICTFDYVIGDMLELFPSENAVLAILPIFQKIAMKAFDEIVKAWYRVLHQQGKIKVLELLTIYQFIVKFSGRLDAYGDFSVYTTDHSNSNMNMIASEAERVKMLDKWKMRRVELYKIALTSLGGELKAMVIKPTLSMPGYNAGPSVSTCSAGWEVVPSQSTSWMPFVRRCEEIAAMARGGTGSSSGSGGGTSGGGTDMSDMDSMGIDGQPINPAALPISAIASLSTLIQQTSNGVLPEMKWVSDLLTHIRSLCVNGILKCPLVEGMSSSLSPPPSMAQQTQGQQSQQQMMPSDIRYTLLLQLVESLKDWLQVQNEFIACQLSMNSVTTTVTVSDPMYTLTFIAFINSHLHFSHDILHLWTEDILDELPNNTESEGKTIRLLQDKLTQTVSCEVEFIFQAMEKYVEITCQQEIYKLMTDYLFTKKNGHNWDKDIYWIVTLKKNLKSRLLMINYLLDHKYTNGGSNSHTSNKRVFQQRSNKLFSSVLSLEDLKLRLVLFISQYLVSVYIEMLLQSTIASTCFHVTSNTGTPGQGHQDLLTRVNDDIQLIISSIEEFRAIMISPQQVEDNTHFIHGSETGSASGREGDLSSSPSTMTTSTTSGKSMLGKLMKQRNTTSTPTNRETSASISSKGNVGMTRSGSMNSLPTNSTVVGGSNGGSNGVSIFANLGNYHNKQLFDEIVLPLSHLSIILSMMMTFSASNYIIPFVQQELTQSFGVYSVNIWQLLCSWRGDKKEAITLEYNGSLRDWHIRKQNEMIRGNNDDDEPRVDISFIAKVKAANIIKNL